MHWNVGDLLYIGSTICKYLGKDKWQTSEGTIESSFQVRGRVKRRQDSLRDKLDLYDRILNPDNWSDNEDLS